MAKKKYSEPVAYDQSVGKQYASLPSGVTSCANYKKLSYEAKALIQDAGTLFSGRNNGDIALTYSVMHELGWSKRKLFLARHELEHYRFINMTRQGGSHSPSLFSLAWINIHRCNNKLDVPATNSPACTYLVEKPKYEPKKTAKSIQSETAKLLTTGELSEREIKNSGSPLIPKCPTVGAREELKT